jgi:hypothetical protein
VSPATVPAACSRATPPSRMRSGCGDQILGARTIYVFSLADLTFAFHIGCYGLWLGELVRRGLYRPT